MSPRAAAGSAPRRSPTLTILAVGAAAAAVATGGCGLVSTGGSTDELVRPDTVAEAEPPETEPPETDPVAPLARGDFAEATARLAGLARQCDRGKLGRRAILMRAMLELDPRNPTGSPDTAALLAGRYLQLPDAEPMGIAMAETVYLLALDRGGSPVEEPWAYPAVAPRFTGCDRSGALPGHLRELPTHPGTPASRALADTWRALRVARDQVEALQAELERIRKLLGREPGPR